MLAIWIVNLNWKWSQLFSEELSCNLNNSRPKLKMAIVLDGKPMLKLHGHVLCRFIEIEWVIQGSFRMINCVYIVGCFALCESIPMMWLRPTIAWTMLFCVDWISWFLYLKYCNCLWSNSFCICDLFFSITRFVSCILSSEATSLEVLLSVASTMLLWIDEDLFFIPMLPRVALFKMGLVVR